MKNIVNDIDEFHDQLICRFITTLDEILKTTNSITFNQPLDLQYKTSDGNIRNFKATAITKAFLGFDLVGINPDYTFNYVYFIHNLDNFYKLAEAISQIQENIN